MTTTDEPMATDEQGAPGGRPQPSDDQHEHDTEQDGAEASVEETDAPAGDVDAEDQEETRGLPAGQWLLTAGSAVALLGTLLWQTLGVVGMVVGGLVTAGGVALYRGRKDQGRTGGIWGRTRQGGRAAGAPASFGRGSGRGRGLGGMLGGGSRSGRGRGGSSRLGIPGLAGKGRGSAGGRGGAKGGVLGGLGSRRGSGAGGGRLGRMFGAAGKSGRTATTTAGKSTGRAGSQAGSHGGRTSARPGKGTGKTSTGAAGRGKVGGSSRPSLVGRALRAADARTGHRASRAAAKAARWADAKTGGKAGRAVKSTRSAWKRTAPHRRTAVAALVAGLAAASALTMPAWAVLCGGAATAAGAEAWRRRRRRQAAKALAAQIDADHAEALQIHAEIADLRRCPHCLMPIRRSGPVPGTDPEPGYLFCPHCHRAYAYDPSKFKAPQDAEPTRDHTNTRTSTNTRTRRNAMDSSGFPIAVAAAEVNTAAASYAPPDMWAVATDLRQLPDVFASIALAVRTYTQRLEGDYPIDQAVVQEIGQIYMTLTQVAQHAQEIEPLFRRLHAEDLKRGETPRVGEDTWNV